MAHLVTSYNNKDAYKTKQQLFSTVIMDTDLEGEEITWPHVGNEPEKLHDIAPVTQLVGEQELQLTFLNSQSRVIFKSTQCRSNPRYISS